MMEKEKLSYKLENFEGPLDLLLFLIAKKKLQIVDISISELVDQYMEQIEAMREQDMDIASEFVEMAGIYQNGFSSSETRRSRRAEKRTGRAAAGVSGVQTCGGAAFQNDFL